MSKIHPQIPEELRTPSPEFLAGTEAMGLYWWHWDHRAKFLSIAPSLMRLLGYSEEEFDPSVPTLDKNVHPDDLRENLKRIIRLLHGETELYEMEYRVRDEDGEWNWYYNRGRVMEKSDDGKVTTIGGVTMRMSGNYKHLMSIVQEKEKFEFIFRSTNEAVVVLELKENKPGRVIEANKAAMALLERSPGEMKQVPQDLRDDPILGEQGALIKQVVDKGYGKIEYRLDLPDNRFRWVEVTAHAFLRTGEDLIVAIFKDVTHDKEAEAALRESERLYQTLVEAADDAIGLYEANMEVVLVNSAMYENFGYTREEFDALAPLGLIHPEDRDLLLSLLPKVLKEGNLSLDFRVVHKSGKIRHVSSKNVVIRGETAEKDLILTIVRDVTDHMQAMEELKQAKKRAEESDKLKSAFLANMSHEIRTPMNSIVGFSNLLASEDLQDEALSLYVKRIIRNSEILLALISDIIDLARIESGQLALIYGKQNISSLVADLGQYAREECERLGKNSIEVREAGENQECLIETDRIRLVQVMKNLINNAIKFTETGTIAIGCRLIPEEGLVRFFVEDSGIGISEADFELIFDQFRQVDSSNTRKFGGTGLGLAISRNLVQMMGGRIWVESKLGDGALFQVELPLTSVTGSVPGPDTLKAPEAAPAIPESKRIMVVDDDPDSLFLFKEILEKDGHSVICATTGYEALMVLDHNIDLVFMDAQMPVLSGTETMRIIRERQKHVLIVAQSAHALVGDEERFVREGFDAYLPKPFTGEQLNSVMASLFR